MKGFRNIVVHRYGKDFYAFMEQSRYFWKANDLVAIPKDI
jgi:hypothetical protein